MQAGGLLIHLVTALGAVREETLASARSQSVGSDPRWSDNKERLANLRVDSVLLDSAARPSAER